MSLDKWRNKNVLVLGDSIAADGRWEKEFARLTGANVKIHAWGGINIIDMVEGLGASENDMKYDPHTGCNGCFTPLSNEEVGEADLIIVDGAYNERHMEYGEKGDMYPENNTLRGKFAYVINKLYNMMEETDNLDCHIMLVTPHCSGLYDWVNADGYTEFPEGSGRSLETMAKLICEIAGENNLYCCDAWHTSGIGRRTWKIYCASPVVMREDYDPEKEYDAPYPWYADQAHMNDRGYARLGQCIAYASELA